MSNCDIAFVTKPSEFGEFLPFPAMALSAYVKKQGFSSVIIDTNPIFRTPFTIDDPRYTAFFNYLKSELIKLQPRYIGLGAFTSDYDFIIKFSSDIKQYVNSKIIVGNVHATIQPDDFIFKDSPVDMAVRGEGELTLGELLGLGAGTPENLVKIDGLCFYDYSADKVVLTNKRALIKDLSILPFPAYEDVDMAYYTRPLKRVIGYAYYVIVPIYSGRGCPFRCKFCASSNVWGQHSTRFISVDKLIEEIKMLKERWKIDAVYLLDDTFTFSKPRVYEFCEKIKPLNLVWAAQTRVNLIDEPLVAAMRDSGCTQLTFGVESGSQRLLNLMQKGCRVEETKRAFALCKKYKMRTLANMMFNLPTEEEEDVRLSLELLKEIRPDELGAGLTVAYPGTEIYEQFFPDKFNKEDYYLLAEARGFGTGRFKLCNHNLDLQRVLADTRMDLAIVPLFPLFIRILFSSEYWRMLRRSSHKMAYLKAILKDLPVGLFRTLGIITYNVGKHTPKRYQQLIVRLASIYGKKFGN